MLQGIANFLLHLQHPYTKSICVIPNFGHPELKHHTNGNSISDSAIALHTCSGGQKSSCADARPRVRIVTKANILTMLSCRDMDVNYFLIKNAQLFKKLRKIIPIMYPLFHFFLSYLMQVSTSYTVIYPISSSINKCFHPI